ncbi:hypothetical protein [Actinomadura opuntiae]|uniref:hypothetical protein n=1 Tax=Actinomadura sp. OS1-43 TaxID=604315 RepID=UPI00255B1549|nr:hypothetical protein [Actinomadura sp. OS1-43]MDL4815479.1 hypothetical protein [Actinomadura sp. OS1-43]
MPARYLLRGQPVRVLVKFALPSKRNPAVPVPAWLCWHTAPPGAPRNALVEREDGTRFVRPFRGLRRDLTAT